LRESPSTEDVMKQMTLILEQAATSDVDALVTNEIRERVLDLMAALLAAALRARREVADEYPSSER
jgi:2-methylcitrate dehydratase PrpD